LPFKIGMIMSKKIFANDKILIVPNSELAEYEGELKIVSSDRAFYKEFKEYDIEVIICAIVNKKNKNYGWDINTESNISHIKQNLVFSNESRFKKTINYLYMIFKSFKVVKNYSFFYLFIPGNVSLIYALVLIILNKKFGLYIRGDFSRNRFHFIYKFIIKKSSFAIVTGNHIKGQIKSLNQHVKLVVPMINTSCKDLQEERFIPLNKPFKYLFVGRPSKDKGIDELIEAIHFLKLDGLKFELEIVGDNDKKGNDSLRATIKKYRLENHINFSGFTNNTKKMRDIFRNSDAFILPSHHEGFPRVVYEAMTFGIPMVLTNLPSYMETLNHNIHCEIVEIKNSRSLYEGMKTIATDAKKYNSYSKNTLKFMKKKYQVFEDEKNHTIQVLQEMNK
jgi:glycosyltransferase involved in cell wall biosynthesis